MNFDIVPSVGTLTPIADIEPPPELRAFVVVDAPERVVRVCLPNLGSPPAMTPALLQTLSDYVFRLFDVDDVALVLHNAMHGVDKEGWSWSYLKARLAPVMHHKFKRFEAVVAADGTLTGEYNESCFIALLFSDFVKYLAAANALREWDMRQSAGAGASSSEFSPHAVRFPSGIQADSDPSAVPDCADDGTTAVSPHGPPLYVEVRDEKVRRLCFHFQYFHLFNVLALCDRSKYVRIFAE
jgi:hypothetical protein